MTKIDGKAVPWDVPIGTIVRIIDKESCYNFHAEGLHQGQLGKVIGNKYDSKPDGQHYIRVNFGSFSWCILIKDIELVSQEELTQLGELKF